MRTEYRVLALAMILALVLWLFDALWYRLFFQGLLPSSLDPRRTEHDLILRSLASGYVLIFGCVMAITIAQRKRAEREREELISQLREALRNVRTLRGLLPICANCKRIRDDQGYWRSVEAYVREHSEAEFTHGLCPDCLAKLYPEYAETGQSPQEAPGQGPEQRGAGDAQAAS